MGYVVLLLALFVRFQPPGAPAPPPLHVAADEPFGLIRAHHAVFYAILLGAPVEVAVRGGAPHGRAIGVLAFALGVALYRVAARALGESLSPLVAPRPGAPLVTAGPYRWLRHPMYLGQALIAVGAPLTLGARWTLWLAAPALVILGIRARLEDAVLARTFPEHARWATRAKSLVPFVF